MAVNNSPSFASSGKVTTGFDTTLFNYARSVITQPDGKIILAGYSFDRNHADQFLLARYNKDGTLDTTFSGDGKVTTPNISQYGDYINDAALQADGKILIVGIAHSGVGATGDIVLLRYNADGTQDMSFDGDGIVTTDFGSLGDDSGNSIVIQSDGKILVAGGSYNGSNYDFALVRYNSNGSLDTSFGVSGKLTTDFNQGESAGGVIIQPDGKIIVTGSSPAFYYGEITFNNFELARYNSDGTLDASFGNGGKAITEVRMNATDVQIQTDGKIIVAGTGSLGLEYGYDFALTRFNTNGSLDTTFGINGRVFTDTNNLGEDHGYKLAIQPDGKIILVGIGVNDFAIARYNTNGTLDTSFGNNGKVTTDFNGGVDTGFGVTIQSDGKILVAGNSYDLIRGVVDFALVRLNPDGTLDASFNSQNTLSSLNEFTSFNFFENGLPIALDTNVQIYDLELNALNNYNGASITLSRHGTANAEDEFHSINNLDFNGNTAFLYGENIGSVTNINGILNITFNSRATQTKVNEVLGSFAYSNNSANPPTSVQIDWVFNDGNTGSQGTGGALNAIGHTTVNITPNDFISTINGTAGNDILIGGIDVDFIIGGLGNDILDGGAGTDTAVFNINRAAVTEVRHTKAGGAYILSSEGADTLVGIENLQFLDGIISAGASGDVIRDLIATRPLPTFAGATNPVSLYTGAVAFLEYEYIGSSAGDSVAGSNGNDFINLIAGDDAANGGAGDDVLDGGTGSNFLTGGGGNDTFFLDGRSGTTTWSTITDYNAGDQVNIWGWALGTSKLLLTQASAGATGYEGVTYHYDLNNDNTIDTSITFTGLTATQITPINPFAGVLIIG